ncbi:MAG: phospholipase D-like domain-containing protein [Candidatus Competibacteraceae bacterium]|nr:phospholipase D-like domain-containing protein [Candidatus Competibacteraceae bacterium]
MPRIFDNIEKALLPALQGTLEVAERGDFCVGYFNLRGWRHLAGHVDRWAGGADRCCRLLVGMHVSPSDELRRALLARETDQDLDNPTAIREKRRIAEEFRQQLTFGAPSNADEAALRQLAGQIRAGKLVVKVYLRHPLHAKLYLLFRRDPINPIIAYLGSSNLTLAGLSQQGELNVDVLDSDATAKLAAWFEDRWRDRWCLDISRRPVRTSSTRAGPAQEARAA